MKFSQATAAAMLAATAASQAIPVAEPVDTTNLEVRASADEVIAALQNVVDVINSKREVTVTQDDFNLMTRDIDWGSLINKLLSYLPGLITTVWNSGVIQKLWDSLWSSQAFRDGLVSALKWVLTTATSLINKYFGSSSSTTNTKRTLDLLDRLQYDTELSARDAGSTLSDIITSIWNSGIIQKLFTSVFDWVKANPETFQSILSSAGTFLVNIGSQLFSWLQSSGLLEKGLLWLGANIGTIIQWVLKLVGQLFGGSSTSTASTTPASASGAAKKRSRVNY